MNHPHSFIFYYCSLLRKISFTDYFLVLDFNIPLREESLKLLLLSYILPTRKSRFKASECHL